MCISKRANRALLKVHDSETSQSDCSIWEYCNLIGCFKSVTAKCVHFETLKKTLGVFDKYIDLKLYGKMKEIIIKTKMADDYIEAI